MNDDDRINRAITRAAVEAAAIVGNAIRDCGDAGIPYSLLAGALTSQMSLTTFGDIVYALVLAGLVQARYEPSSGPFGDSVSRLVWVGPSPHRFAPRLRNPLKCKVCGMSVGAIVHV